MSNKKRLLAMAGLTTVLILSGCNKHKNDTQPQKTPAAKAPISINDKNSGNEDDLSSALSEQPHQGGIISMSPHVLLADVNAGGNIQKTMTITNAGDDTMKITNITATGSPVGLSFSGTCTHDNINILPNQSCDLIVTYRDATGDNLNTIVMISTNSKRNPIARFDVNIAVKNQEGNPLGNQNLPDQQNNDQTMDASEQAWAQRLAAARQSRFSDDSNNQSTGTLQPSTLSRGMQNGDNLQNNGNTSNNLNIQPIVGVTDTQPRYDPNRMPWTETTLKVNRKYILTADRVIPAVIEQPVSAIMCNVVRAVVDQNVYSPDSDNILIPAGTKALGHCGKFTDERTNIEWFRLITPQGVNITFNKLQADTGDAMGQGGVPGRIVQKDLDRYAAPILESLIDIGTNVARAIVGQNQTTSYNNLSGQQSNSESKYDTAIDDFTQRGRNTVINGIQSMLDQRRNVVIQAGTRIIIQPQEDIYFKTPTEVIRLADYEYQIQKQYMPPTAVEQPAPTISITPQITQNNDEGNQRQTIVVNGQTYTIGETNVDPKTQRAAGAFSGGMQNNAAANGQGFFNGDPQYASQNPARGRGAVSSTYGGISNLNNALAAGYSGPGSNTNMSGGSGSFGASENNNTNNNNNNSNANY